MGGAGTGGAVSGGEDAAAKRRKLERKLREVVEENNRLKEELGRARYRIKRLSSTHHRLVDQLNKQSATASDEDASDGFSSGIDGDDVSSDGDSDLSIDDTPLLFGDDLSNIVPMSTPSKPKSALSPMGSPPASAAQGSTPGGTKKKSGGGSGSSALRGVAASGGGSGGEKSVPIRRLAFKVQYDDDGNPVLPIKIGVLRVTKLGTVRYDVPSFHSARYIWPIGYESIRSYASMISADKQNVDYVCRISSGLAEGSTGEVPIFEILPSDQPGYVISHHSPTGAWTTVLRAANRLRNKETSNSASGPDYFGFSHPVIAKLIQELPNADKCIGYIKQEFIEQYGMSAARKKAGGGSVMPSTGAKGKQQRSSKDDGDDKEDDDEVNDDDGSSQQKQQNQAALFKQETGNNEDMDQDMDGGNDDEDGGDDEDDGDERAEADMEDVKID